MSKARSVFRCTDCGGASPKWVGRCPSCGEWNTLVEEVDVRTSVASRGSALPSIGPCPSPRSTPTSGSPGPPGSPRSTGCSAAASCRDRSPCSAASRASASPRCCCRWPRPWPSRGPPCSTCRPRSPSSRFASGPSGWAPLAPRLYLASETALPHVVAHLDEIKPDLLIVDSIQTVYEPELSSAAGSVAQVRECAARLVREAKARSVSTVLVGHVTKDGGLAGPRVLEHVVDTVLAFEGERHHALRLLRASKHRFGSTDELGLFEMTEAGLAAVPDASGLFLADRRPGVSGSVVVPTIEGHRPLLVEVQALVVDSTLPSPRRSAQGVDPGRLSLLLAVLQQRAGIELGKRDVYALAVGGVVVREPGCRPGRGPGHRVGRHRGAAPARHRGRAARSASAASCGRWPRATAGWPRPPASGSRGPSCPAWPRAAAGHHRAAGRRPHRCHRAGRVGRRRSDARPRVRCAPPDRPQPVPVSRSHPASSYRGRARTDDTLPAWPAGEVTRCSMRSAPWRRASPCERASTASSRPRWAR